MSRITPKQRQEFDRLFDGVMAALPEALHRLVEEVPVIVDDQPSAELLRECQAEGPDEICGLHSGMSLAERGPDSHRSEPETIHIYRLGIIAEAGGDDADDAAVTEEIRVTLLHEIGHHFGLSEDDLEKLGYG